MWLLRELKSFHILLLSGEQRVSAEPQLCKVTNLGRTRAEFLQEHTLWTLEKHWDEETAPLWRKCIC